MSLVRVHNFSISLDGFGAGEGQQLDAPFGHAGSRLMEWAMGTRTFREMGIPGESKGSFGVDDALASRRAPGSVEPSARFDIEATPSPLGVVHLFFTRRTAR
jgi:hypothetical protein